MDKYLESVYEIYRAVPAEVQSELLDCFTAEQREYIESRELDRIESEKIDRLKGQLQLARYDNRVVSATIQILIMCPRPYDNMWLSWLSRPERVAVDSRIRYLENL